MNDLVKIISEDKHNYSDIIDLFATQYSQATWFDSLISKVYSTFDFYKSRIFGKKVIKDDKESCFVLRQVGDDSYQWHKYIDPIDEFISMVGGRKYIESMIWKIQENLDTPVLSKEEILDSWKQKGIIFLGSTLDNFKANRLFSNAQSGLEIYRQQCIDECWFWYLKLDKIGDDKYKWNLDLRIC